MSEEGLNYTIRFIPDTTEINKAVKEISEQVTREIGEGVAKAKEEAGSVGSGADDGRLTGIMDQFKSIKDKLSSTLKEFGILSGRARSTQHPSSATVGSVTQLAAQKAQDGDLSNLSKDQLLQLTAGTIVAAGRALSAKELRPGLSANEAVEQSMQDQLGSLKGISEGMFGFKEFKSMKGLANMIRMADFYERSSSATGKGRVKEIEQGFMQAVGHDIITDSMKQIMAQELGSADWEASELRFSDFAQKFGMSEQDANALSFANDKVADVVRKVGDVLQIGEAKTVGKSSEIPKLVRDIENVMKVLGLTGNADTKVVAKMYAGATQGNPALVMSQKDTEMGDNVDLGYEEIGTPVKAAIIRSFQQELPTMQRELQTLLIDTTPGAARAHIEQLLYLIEEELKVLEAHSLPDFWVKIGVPQWIRTSAISYVNTLKDEIEPLMQDMIGEEAITGITPPETSSDESSIESKRILGLLNTMDSKLDNIQDSLPRSSGDAYGGMIGSMKTYGDR